MTDQRVVYDPPANDHHACGPGWVWNEHGLTDPSTGHQYLPAGYFWRDPTDADPVGRVVACSCGQTWVCVWVPEQLGRWTSRVGHKSWVKETRRERKRRERKQRRVTPVT